MRELSCTCGTCALEPIVSCRCDYAAKLRADVLAELDKRDLSTDERRRHAVDEIRKLLVARHGEKIIRHGVEADAYFAEVVVASALVLGALFYVLSRRLRRGDDDSLSS